MAGPVEQFFHQFDFDARELRCHKIAFTTSAFYMVLTVTGESRGRIPFILKDRDAPWL
ncbi:hypothetical protein [Limoniibacter endophyticus]|uniref:Uncharacterized protein n=1 Tax=Limoniibacter endophyticus TaxID=1565040 RepID=A0A8J3DHW3_9HYPH|nr:hypothetical protein [Limoniibacter endophyticus]GHC68571.1 hypothetical protein GCM10010136_13410 [Limoniibacter endophyticus]